MDIVTTAGADISVRKRDEAAMLRMNAQLEEFTYIASHDLRSPLRGIADLLAWIREDLQGIALPEPVIRNFERAELRIARAERMIEDLLEYARSGQTEAETVLTDPRRLVEEVLAALPAPAHFSIETDIRGTPFRCAVTALSLALRNLIGNSFKHHGRPAARLAITMREEGAYNVFTVADDGVGVPPGEAERIFQLFYRPGNVTPGHGMGLAITRRAVTANGGFITLDDAGPEGGACFRIRWPRYPVKEA